jgi:hypothetical protein
MRKFIRLLFALVLGFIAFEVVELWPVTPMWTSADFSTDFPGFCPEDILGFCAARNSILASVEGGEPHGQRGDYLIIEKNIDTGAEVGRWELPFREKDDYVYIIQVLPDGQKLFVDYEHYDSTQPHTKGEHRQHQFRIVDAQTGKTLSGPFAYEGWGETVFSSTAKWFMTPVRNSSRGKDIISTFTGEVVLRLRDDKKVHSYFLKESFAPDDSAVAIQLLKDTGQYVIEIYDLPAGLLRFAHTLAGDLLGCEIEKWDRDGLHLLKRSERDDPNNFEVHSYSVQVHKDRLSALKQEPGLYGYASKTEDLTTYMTRLEFGDRLVHKTEFRGKDQQTWLNDVLAWIDDKCGIHLHRSGDLKVDMDFFGRASGKLLYQLHFASPKADIKAEISPDGRRVASVNAVKGLMMWDADPFPRWPWALGTGLLTFLLVYFLPSLRKRPARATFSFSSSSAWASVS